MATEIMEATEIESKVVTEITETKVDMAEAIVITTKTVREMTTDSEMVVMDLRDASITETDQIATKDTEEERITRDSITTEMATAEVVPILTGLASIKEVEVTSVKEEAEVDLLVVDLNSLLCQCLRTQRNQGARQ